MTYQQLAQRAFNRTKFTQVMKYYVINYWGMSWPEIDRKIEELTKH